MLNFVKKMRKLFTGILFIALFALSCVPTRQFTELKEKNDQCRDENDSLRVSNEKLLVENKELASKLEVAEEKLKTYREGEGTRKYRELQNEHERLQKEYNQLKSAQEYLLSGSAEETTELLKELQMAQENLQKREEKLRDFEIALNEKSKNLDMLKSELERNNRRLQEMEDILNRKDAMVNALREKISNALLGFENQGLTVTQKNGKVYVSLDEKLLFQSGSIEVDQRGVRALKQLAGVLESNPEINIMVEGHTDDVPYISGALIKDNWDLSVLRATSIVKIILENSSIDPKRLIASGRGEFLPVDPAKTAAARQKNRRTEIILFPKLDELYELIEQN